LNIAAAVAALELAESQDPEKGSSTLELARIYQIWVTV